MPSVDIGDPISREILKFIRFYVRRSPALACLTGTRSTMQVLSRQVLYISTDSVAGHCSSDHIHAAFTGMVATVVHCNMLLSMRRAST